MTDTSYEAGMGKLFEFLSEAEDALIPARLSPAVALGGAGWSARACGETHSHGLSHIYAAVQPFVCCLPQTFVPHP